MEEQKYNIEYKEEYFSDIQKHKKSGDKNTLKKIGSFLLEIENTPTRGLGKPEQLKGYKERSIWSRRIDQKHRLVYEIFSEEYKVVVISAYGHYDDK